MVSKRGLNPKFPVVQGHHKLNAAWSLELPGEFNRRIEDGDLVLWRPGMTMFIAIWNNDRGESIPARLEWLREDMNPAAFDHVEETDGTSQRFAYRLAEDGDDDRVPALYGFTVADSSHVQLAVYFDSENDTAAALELWRSVAQAERSTDP